ncbi:MAG: repair protein RecO protein [Candidatus Moranbacteria bacterium GW2011_GWF2_36_839]|nr:MAG: repair protein RecO protein [Candidatus Moranbacteria bacterium GW2011_GWF1_36_78]KKQ17548.1 MAG: repair protein RecO protein [Candidatus Moranbacteria bacterium GW2011_GWF2_36_839]
MEYKYNAIVLNKIDTGETDRVYVVYTREAGRILARAIGVKKPNAKLAGNLESITQCEIFLAKGKGRGNITGVIPMENFLAIKENIFALEKVFGVMKIFNRLMTQEEKDEKTFQLLLEYLLMMNDEAGKAEKDILKFDIYTLGFIFKLLQNLGYKQEAKKCAVCAGKLISGENYFSAERGGIICSNCAKQETKKIRINDEGVKFIRIVLENKMENLGKIKLEKKNLNNLNNLKIIVREAVRWITN